MARKGAFFKRREPIQPDKLTLFLEKSQFFIQNNLRMFSAICLILIVLVSVFGIWKFNRVKAEEKASKDLYNAIKLFNAKNFSTGNSHPATEKEGLSAALKKFKEIYNNYPDTQAGTVALFYEGSSSFYMGQFEKSVSCYRKFLEKIGDKRHYLKPFAYEGLGYAYEAKGNYKKAIDWFERQKEQNQNGLQMMSLVNLGRCYDALDNINKSCECYQEFIEKYPDSSFVEIAKFKIFSLCKKANRDKKGLY